MAINISKYVPSLLRVGSAVLWTGYFFVLLVQPSEQPLVNTTLPAGPPSLQRELLFTSLHVLTFAFTTLLWVWALSSFCNLRRALWISAMLVLCLGVGTELWQASVPGRSTQIWDMSANILGVVIGCWLAWQISKRR